MKRFFIIIGILAVSVLSGISCTNDIEDFSEGQDTLLVMNSLMNSDDTTHSVYLSLSHGPSVSNAHNGIVQCFVNGNLVATTNKGNNNDIESSKYDFKAIFKAGDVVKIVATSRGKTVYSEVTVPQAVAGISKVDTAKVKSYYDDNWKDYEQFRTTIEDQKNVKNYYRFVIVLEKTILGDDGKKYNAGNEECEVIGKDDPVLSGGSVNSDGTDFLTGNSDNKYNIFTDKMFADGSYTMKANVDYNSLHNISTSEYITGNYFNLKIKAHIKVYTIPEKEFHYLKARANDDGDFFSGEPVIFPENVKGGLGFVAVATPTVYTCTFPDIRYKNGYY